MKRVKFLGAILILTGILLRPEAAVAGAQRAMRLWVSSVAPALFPFLALMPALTGPDACAAYDALLSRFMRPLFGLPGSAAPALVIGMISGSPGGALAVRRVAGQAGLQKGEAKRLALALCGLSPAYLVLGVGQSIYGSTALGTRLVLIQLATQFGLLFLLRGIGNRDEELVSALPEDADRAPIRAAVENVLAVCGYMVFFSAICCVAASFTGQRTGAALLLLSDLPSGLAELAHWEFPGKLLLQGAAIGFGGLCIAAQNLDALRPLGVTPREYFATRGVAAAAIAAASGLFLRTPTPGAEVFAHNNSKVYAISLLAAGLLALPALFFFSKTFYLNKRRNRA